MVGYTLYQGIWKLFKALCNPEAIEPYGGLADSRSESPVVREEQNKVKISVEVQT